MAVAALPGLTVEVLRPLAEQSPLRNDVAGVIGRTRRGPVGVPVRVTGRRDLEAEFGGLDARFATGYSLRGYFENGGEVLHVVRLPGEGAAVADAIWVVGEVAGPPGAPAWAPDAPAGAGFAAASYRVQAISPGTWADDTRVTIAYHAIGLAGRHELELRVEVPNEEAELFEGVDPAELEQVLAGSRFVRVIAEGPPAPAGADHGPTVKRWDPVVLGGGADPIPGRDDYLRAVALLGEVPEVALVTVPDLHADLSTDGGHAATLVLGVLLADAAARQDRLVLVDVPAAPGGAALPPDEASAWVAGLRGALDDDQLRATAVYHPWVRVRDPLGRTVSPLRDVPPSGHVAGLASRLDRERGAQHTPANTLLADAVDLTAALDERQESLVHAAGINLLRCRPGRGLEVWGGRTLDPDRLRRFVAHRRLLHRLVRAIRRVAEPLVFEPNGPELWFALVRGISSVLLEAWRAGGLKGATRDEAFRVICDETTNPPDAIDAGQLLCEIDLAPAAPMEFITVRLTIARQGQLEVVEQ
jgi:hypothetical protein